MASIASPTSLATFPLSHASSSKHPHVTLSPVVGAEGRLAVAAVQGDGIWTYDLDTLRPTTSFTVPPSTRFITPPISFYHDFRSPARQTDMEVDDDGEPAEHRRKERVTAVVVGDEKGGQGRNVWLWIGEEGDKQTATLGTNILAIFHLDHPTHPILILDEASNLTLLSTTLALSPLPCAPIPPKIVASKLLPSWRGSEPRLALVHMDGRVTSLKLHLLEGEKSHGTEGGHGQLDLSGASRLVRADISPSGWVTALDDKNRLHSDRLENLVSPQSSSQTRKAPLRLVHASDPPLPLLSLPTPSASPHPLSLIASLHPTPSILLATPSSSLPAILATSPVSTLTTPAALAQVSNLTPLSAPTSTRSLVIGMVLTHTSESAGRSILHICEISVPPRGIGLSDLLGSRARSAEYFDIEKPSAQIGMSAGFDGVIEGVRSALVRGGEEGELEAERVWSEWLGRPEQGGKSGEGEARRVLEVIFEVALPSMDSKRDLQLEEPSSAVAGSAEQRQDAHMEIDAQPSSVYARKIVGDLIRTGGIGNGVLAGGLVERGLIPLADWDNIFAALATFRSLPSSTIIAVLRATMTLPKAAPPARGGNVQLPTRSQALARIVGLGVPPPDYKAELRKRLPVEEAEQFLRVIARWMDRHVAERSLRVGKWGTKGIANVQVSPDLPELQNIITHTTALLDSHLPLLLAHPASYPTIERIHATLPELVQALHELRAVLAPIDALATLGRREQAMIEEERERHGVRNLGGSKASKWRKDKEEQAEKRLQGSLVGGGILEEGKTSWRVEEFVF